MKKTFTKTLVILLTLCMLTALLPAAATVSADAVPSIARWTREQVDNDGFYFYAQVADNGAGITKVEFPTWLKTASSSEIVWFEATAGDYTCNGQSYNYKAHIPVSSFNNQTDTPFVTHVYVRYGADENTAADAGEFSMAELPVFTCSDITGGVSITGCTNIANFSDLVIPAEIGGKTVLEIGARAFKDCAGLVSVSFAEGSGLKTIGKEAFRGTGLTAVTLPDSLETIADGAFKYDYSLASVTFGSGLKSIGEYAFSNTALVSVALPAGFETVKKAGFFQCYSLSSVDLGGIKTIGADAFEYTALEAVVFPDTLETVGEGAFKHDSSLASVTLNVGLTSIGEYVIDDNALAAIRYPEYRKAWNARGGWEYLGVTEQNNPYLVASPLVCKGDFAPETAIALTGTERYGETLTAAVTDLPDDVLDAVINWYNADGDRLGAGETYVLTAADVGGSVKAVLSSENAATSLSSDLTGAIGKARITGYKLPTAAPITYPQTLAEATLTGGDTGGIEGVWAWVLPDEKPTSEQNGSLYDLTFTPTGEYAALYETINAKLAITVEPAPFEPKTVVDAAAGIALEADFAQGVELTLTDIPYSQSAYLALLRASDKDTSGLGKLVLFKTFDFTVNGEATDEAYTGAVTVTSAVGEKFAGREYSVWFFVDGAPVNYVGTVNADGVLVIDGVEL
ncbi:MAG: leucine-rich repeat protein [Clostridia bacterium]|nr:leucine-rich repeat protein [Clostridia bacterium]